MEKPLAMLNLSCDPFRVFRESRTPAGLYARQKWLGEADTPEWQDDFQRTVSALLEGQSGDGSWNQSPSACIQRLFGLHLTVRSATREIERGLDWLMKHTLTPNAWKPAGRRESLPPDAFRELPFSPGQARLSLACATLFLAAVFQKTDEPAVAIHYRLLARRVADGAGNAETWSDRDNALRAFVAHPQYAESAATAALVDRLGAIQDPAGYWADPVPFYRTFNALAHLRLETANRQWIRSLQVLSEKQNRDGTWGDADLEWITFLVVHALKNKACL